MQWIVPAIASLEQHLKSLAETPRIYRPQRCPSCGLARLWGHGCYTRKADRDSGSEPIQIPRFLCPGCHSSCSSLPEYLSPRRWYDWTVQAAVLALLLTQVSIRACAVRCGLTRRTVRRWWHRLQEQHTRFAFFLKGRTPELGRAGSVGEFWQRCLERWGLAELMRSLHGEGVVVP